MTERAEATPGRAKGSPQLIILLVVILGPTLLIGQAFGAGAAAIIGGFVALFSLISSMGGPLRANLRRFAFVGPLVAFGSVAPRLLVEVSIPAAISLATLVVFVAGLLPLRSRRYDGTALGLGMGTLLGYSLPLGVTTGPQLIAAAIGGLIVALAMLVLTGLKDPSAPTRTAAADLLRGDKNDFGTAFDLWSSDRAPRWLGSVLLGAGRYRLAARVLERTPDPDGSVQAALAKAQARAESIAAIVEEKRPTGPMERTDHSASVGLNSAPTLERMSEALDDVERAAEERDLAPMPIPQSLRSRVNAQTIRAAVGYGSLQFRHAVRTTVAVLLAFLVSLFLPHGDPLLPTLLMTTFGLVQVSWHATLSRAKDRFVGILAGGVIVVFVLLVLPPALLFPISMIGLAVGMWFITARPALGTAGLIAMSVGLNSELRHLDPFVVVTEYIVLTLIALLIGSVIGFLIVPSWRPPAVPLRVESAVDQTAAALAALGAEATSDLSELRLQAVADAQAATQQLVPDHEKLTAPQAEQLILLRNVLEDVLITSIFMATTDREGSASRLTRASVELGTYLGDLPDPEGDQPDEPILLLVGEVQEKRRLLEQLLQDGR